MVPSLIWFSVSTKSHFDFCRYFLLNFQCQRRSFLSQCRFRWLGEKLYFCDSTSKAFAFLLLSLRGQTRCSKDYDSPRGLCTGKIYDFPRVSGLLRIHARLHRPPLLLLLLFFSICHVAALSRQLITSVEFRFVTRQVVVVTRAAKIKFVAERRTRVDFAQHAAATCNTVFYRETSWSQT